jgi:3-isopropylmalate dehydrogenase
MAYKIITLPGDGIGPDVCNQSLRVLKVVCEHYKIDLDIREALIGGAAYDQTGTPLPQETIDLCTQADAVLLGAVGGPRWDNIEVKNRPEQGLLGIRQAMGLFVNIRPVIVYPELTDASPLKDSIVAGTDLIVVRELTGGIYFGKRETTNDYAYDTCEYHSYEIERICKFAAKLAVSRKKRLTSVDKANVLDTSRLWRSVCQEVVSKEYPQISLEHMYIDSATMHLITKPSTFDVLVMDNMFGDILSDETSVLSGSMGLLPSASLNDNNNGIYEPIHGSAPDIIGKDIANPIGSILSCAMLLDYSLKAPEAANAIRNAVHKSIAQGYRTIDLVRHSNNDHLSTSAFTSKVIENLS